MLYEEALGMARAYNEAALNYPTRDMWYQICSVSRDRFCLADNFPTTSLPLLFVVRNEFKLLSIRSGYNLVEPSSMIVTIVVGVE
jgi:hypothetical protein